jgi:hypothetical protein
VASERTAFRIERNGWSDGVIGSPGVAPERPSVASLVAAIARACVAADSAEKAAAAVLAPLVQDPRVKAAWIGLTRGTTTTVHSATGPSKDAEPVAHLAASVLERGVNGEARAIAPDAVAKLPGVPGGSVGFAVPFASGEAWRGWLVAAGAWSADEAKDVEHLVAAASGLAWLALARLSAVDRARVAEERVAAEAIPSLPPDRAPDAAPPPSAPASSGANGPVGSGHARPPANGHAPNGHAKPAPAKSGHAQAAGNGNGSGVAHKTLLSAAALDGIRAFVEVTPGAKSPKLADGPTVYTTVHARDASRWIARLLVAVAEGRRTVRVAVEDGPCVRIESDGPLASRAGTSIASVSDEMATRGGSLRVEDAAQQARLYAIFPKA